VEFRPLTELRRRLGPGGVRELLPAFGRLGAVTDDTQMTLFTAEGLLRAAAGRGAGEAPVKDAVVAAVYRSYLRWYLTQGEAAPRGSDRAVLATGWLFSLEALHARRAPGNTCLAALRSGRAGSIDAPLNDSKGCGGVMRAAPVGLLGHNNRLGVDVFRLGCDIAALTHGHPSGYLAAGVLAHAVATLLEGATLREAADDALAELRRYPGHEECLRAAEAAVRLAGEGAPTAARVEGLGGGWVAEEALAIGLYCALVAQTFEEALPLAVTNGGDSDSTGSIAGNLLGASLGDAAIPGRWLAPLELRDEIRTVGADLYARFGTEQGDEHHDHVPAGVADRYPLDAA
jgi:ADP-ribosylglycohydrolase